MRRLYAVASVTCLLFVVVSVSTMAQVFGDVSVRFRSTYGQTWNTGTVPAFIDARLDDDFVKYTEYTGSYAAQSFGLEVALLEILHVGMDVGVQSMQTTAPAYDSLPVLDPDGNVVNNIIEFEGRMLAYDVLLRPSISITLPHDFVVELGARTQVNVTNRMTSTVQIEVSETDVLPVVDQSVVEHPIESWLLYDQEIIDFPKIRVDLDITVGKSFTFDNLKVQFRATYQHGLMDLTTMQSLRSNVLAGTLAFIYKL